MEVKTKMDQKVQEMRGQTMTFSNDGMELSLNVPDTGDVKRVFGTMIDTVVEQQGEIVQLNTDLDKTVKENRIARQKIVSATTDKLQKLLANQLKLEQQLLDAQKNIQNFAYNIQGYVDEHESESVPIEAVTRTHVKIAQNLTLDVGDDPADDASVRSGPVALFPTEDGASPSKLAVHQSQQSMFHPIGDGSSNTTSKKKKRTKSQAVIQAGINYDTIPPYTMPINNVTGKWRWAIKKVLQSIRRKKLKIGFTRTRVEQKQTIAQRLDNIDRDLFVIPQELAKDFQRKLTHLSDEVQQNIQHVKQDLTDYATTTDAHLLETDTKVADIADKINSHDERITKMIDALAQKEEEDIKQVHEQMNTLRKQIRDEIHLEMMRLQQTLEDLTKEFTELDHSAKILMRDIKNTTVLSENPPEDRGVELLTQLLDKDKMTRHQAHRMGIIEGHTDVLHRLLIETKEGIQAMATLYLPKSKSLEFSDTVSIEPAKDSTNPTILSQDDIQALQTLSSKGQVSEGMTKSVKDCLSIMYGMLQRHDELLRDTALAVIGESVQALDMLPGLQTQLSSAIASNAALQESLNQLLAEKNMLKNQLTAVQTEQTLVREKVTNTEKMLQGQDLGAVTGEMSKMRDQMEGFKSMIAGMQSQMMTIFQTVMIQAQTNNIKNSGGKSLRNSVAASPSLRASMMVQQGQPAPPIPAEVNTGMATVTVPAPTMTAEDSVSAALADESVSVIPVVDAPVDAENTAEGILREGEDAMEHTDEDGDALQMMHQMMGMMLPSGNTSTTNMVSPSVLMQQQPVMDANTMMMMGNMGGGMMLPGGVTEERVEEIVRGILEGLELPSANTSPINKKSSRQLSLSAPTPDESPSNKIKRQASGLMGSFADYNARKSMTRMNSVKLPAHTGPVSNFDPSPLLADIANIRAEAMALQKQLDALNEEKTTKPDVEKMCMDIIRDYRKREARNDYRTMLEDLDVSMREIVHELIGVKKDSERMEQQLRKEFEDALNQAIADTRKDLADQGKETVLSTKALCLGCGRSGMAKMESTSRPMSPSFLPALNAHIQPGPEIMRGGFKLPGRSLSPPSNYPAEIPLLMRNRVQTAPAQAAEATYNAKKSYFSQSADPAFLQQQMQQQESDQLIPTVNSLPVTSQSPSKRPSSFGLRVGFADDEMDILLPPIQSQSSDGGNNTARTGKTTGRIGSSSFSSSLVEGGGSESNLTVTMPAIPLSQLNPVSNNEDDENEALGFVPPITEVQGPASNNPDFSKHVTATHSNTHHNSTLSAGSIIRTNVSASDAETLRPMYRKGFPAKKSFKAEMTYAPERFDLAVRSLGGSSLLSGGSTTSLGGLGVLNNSGHFPQTSQPLRPSTVSSLLRSAADNSSINNTKAQQSRSTVSFANS